MNGRAAQRAETIRLLVLDVDGVLSDGSVVYGNEATSEFKSFNIKDGLGIKLAQNAGIEVAIITGRQSLAVSRRAKELGITSLIQGREDKALALEELVKVYSFTLHQVAYMGDDLPDLKAIKMAGLGACPSDAIALVRENADWISPLSGGCGAVRSLCDFILLCQGKAHQIHDDFS